MVIMPSGGFSTNTSSPWYKSPALRLTFNAIPVALIMTGLMSDRTENAYCR